MQGAIPNNLRISDPIKLQILREVVEPSYMSDVRSIMKSKTCCKHCGQGLEATSKVLVAVGSIISFSAGFFDEPILSFVAGAVSTLSLAMLQVASFNYTEHKKQSTELNILLEKLELDTIPILERAVYMRNAVPVTEVQSVERAESDDQLEPLQNNVSPMT